MSTEPTVKKRLSKRALEARRANAQRSTGPKTVDGKKSVAKNALKHGLSLPITYFPDFRERIDVLAGEVLKDFDATCGELKISASVYNAAMAFADAQLDLERIRAARIEVLGSEIVSVVMPTKADHRRAMMIAKYMSTPEKAAETVLLASLPRNKRSNPPTPKKYATLASLLLKMDRYEKRALARRHRALLELEELTSQSTS